MNDSMIRKQHGAHVAVPQTHSASSHQSTDVPFSAAGRSKTRIEWIDIAKGLGIALVSFGHLRNGDGQSVWLPALNGLIAAIYLFHMPLFYLLGGLTFSRRGGFKAFLIRKVKTLLVPYYVFSLYFLAKPFAILLIPSMRSTFQTSHDYGIAHQFYDVLINGSGLWYLMAFFVAEVLMYGLTSLTRGSRLPLLLIGGGLIVFSFTHNVLFPVIGLPFQLWLGVEIAGFMCIGYVCRNWFKSLRRCSALLLTVVCAAVLAASAVLDLRVCVSENIAWVVAMIAAVSGAFMGVFLCIGIHACKPLAHIGHDSLVYYALNALTLNIAKLLMFRILHVDATSWPFAAQFVIGIVTTLLALAMLWVENLFVQRFMWWAIGKVRPFRNQGAQHE